MQNGIVTLKDNFTVFYKFKHRLLYDPAITFLGIYPSELKITFTQNPVVDLFIIAKAGSNQLNNKTNNPNSQKQSKFPKVGKNT